MATSLDKILYTAKTHVTGGRDGNGRSDDGKLEVRLSPPAQGGPGTNPEQLFGVGYAACFMGAMKAVAPKVGVQVPNDAAIDSEVDLGPTSLGYGISVRLNITLPGMQREQAQKLVEEAHKVCPYSNATRNNIDVKLNIA
jgi:osmotically inducible protein OsmC